MSDRKTPAPWHTISQGIRGEIETDVHEHPTWADYQNRWGLMLLLDGKTEEALETFDRCLEINARYAWASMNRVQALALQYIRSVDTGRVDLYQDILITRLRYFSGDYLQHFGTARFNNTYGLHGVDHLAALLN